HLNDTPTTATNTLSLHDALPICSPTRQCHGRKGAGRSSYARKDCYSSWLDRTNRQEREAKDGSRAKGSRSCPTAAGHALFKANADRKSTRLNSSHVSISYAVFCL